MPSARPTVIPSTPCGCSAHVRGMSRIQTPSSPRICWTQHPLLGKTVGCWRRQGCKYWVHSWQQLREGSLPEYILVKEFPDLIGRLGITITAPAIDADIYNIQQLKGQKQIEKKKSNWKTEENLPSMMSGVSSMFSRT